METPWNNLDLPYHCLVLWLVRSHALSVFFFSFIWLPNITNVCQKHWIDLIYVNLWLLVCQVADQRQFTVGAERAFKSSDAFLFFFFKVDLARMQRSTTHPCGCLTLLFNCSAQTGDSLDKWWLAIVGLTRAPGFFSPEQERETLLMASWCFCEPKPYSCLVVSFRPVSVFRHTFASWVNRVYLL